MVGLRVLCGLLLCGFAGSAFAETVKVGGYVFPPFVMEDDGESRGMTLDMIDALNEIQDEHRFEFFRTSSRRRFQDFQQHRYEVILFEDLRWRWGGIPVAYTHVIARDEEIFLADRAHAGDQTFFDSLENKRLVGMLGYHYAFANYISDQAFMDTQFDILLSSNLRRNMKLILVNRPSVAEVAIMQRSFVEDYMRRHPETRERLLISDRVDQVYQLRGMVGDHAAISADELGALFDQLHERGILPRLLDRYGLPPLQDG